MQIRCAKFAIPSRDALLTLFVILPLLANLIIADGLRRLFCFYKQVVSAWSRGGFITFYAVEGKVMLVRVNSRAVRR